MYGLTRGTITLIGAAAAGFLVWLAVHVTGDAVDTNGDFWVAVGLVAAAGLIVALSQLLGGWTKWGWPRVSGSVYMLAFLPVLVVAGWILASVEPDGNWLRRHVLSWSDDIGVGGLVSDLGRLWPVLAFAIGLFFGLTFDTTGPRTEPLFRRSGGSAALPGPHPLESAPAPRAESRTDLPGATVERDAPPAPDAPAPDIPPRDGRSEP